MKRLDSERQKELEPKRMAFAKKQITGLRYEIIHETDTCLQFVFNGSNVFMYPYSGWHSGRSIKDGRGLNKLLKQIKK